MRLRSLAVVLLLSGCQQSTRLEPASEPARPPSPEKDLGEPSTHPEAPSEPQPSEPQPSPADELPGQTWSARSADGNAEVRQTALRDGRAPRCTSTSTWSRPWDGQSVMWKWNACIATREQLKFVSPDGKRVLVLDPRPASLPGRWRDVEVATLYEHGVRVKGAKAGALANAPVEVREPSPHLAWVQGHAGLPGAPPRYTSDGKAVEFETVDGHSFRLGFEGEGFPAPPEEKHGVAASADMYRYEDEAGTVHFVGSRSDIPERYRSRAAPVEAQLGLFKVSGPLGGWEPPPAESKPAESKPAEPKPKSESPPSASKDPAPPRPLEQPRLASPAELLEQARDTAKQVEESQRDKEKQLDSLTEPR